MSLSQSTEVLEIQKEDVDRNHRGRICSSFGLCCPCSRACHRDFRSSEHW